MRNIFLKIATFTLFAWIGLFLFSGCGKTENPDLSYRVPRSFTEFPLPSNRIDSDKLPKVKDKGKLINIDNNILSMVNGDYRLDFVKKDNNYSLELVYIKDLPSTAPATPDRLMYANAFPAEVYIKSQTTENHFSGYREIVMKDYGFLAQAEFKTAAGSKITVLDHYYFPKESETGVFNIRKAVIVTEAKSADTGFESIYSIGSKGSGTYNWFVPNNIFLNFPSGLTSKVFRETQLGLPMMMMYNADTGYTVSLSRYQPIVNYIDNNFASLTAINSKAEAKIEIAYPSLDTSRKFHPISEGAQHVFDMSLCATRCEDYNTAMISAYNTHFNLQNQRIVDTDIYEVYRVVNEDYKTFLHSKAQKDEDTGKQYTSYGLPWRITIQDGEFGPLTYQAGFIGQQIPSAYQMMLYGIMNNDLKSLQNGLNVIDFWVIAAEFMSLAGVPRIWYDTWADGFREYPCFIRMAVDAMEGLLDAYRLAKAHNINRYEWYDAIEMFANFLVNNQNSDGSYYRCYNYDGGPFENWDNGIEEPPGNIAQSYRKDSTTMPVRFLGKMYELTGD
ncbi:MAG: hypothetical protein M0R05_07860, partial [Bacilli bacterium]|nr:hypothetical protein [Bacilli bacterium]